MKCVELMCMLQVVAVMLKAISGVAATSRRQLSPADRAVALLNNGSSNSSSNDSHHKGNGAVHSSSSTQQGADAHAARHNGNGDVGVQAVRPNESVSREHDTKAPQQQQQQQNVQQSARAGVSMQELGQQSSSPQADSAPADPHHGQQQHAHHQETSSSTHGAGQESGQHETGYQRDSSRSQSFNLGSALSEPFESRDDEVAGTLQNNDHPSSNTQSKGSSSNDPVDWGDDGVLRCLCESTNVSAESWGERLQLPRSFESISDKQEERLVMAACKADGKMLPLFRAYAPHNVLTFVRFARLYCSET